MIKRALALLISGFLLASCTRVIEPVGALGPKKLPVYVVKDNDFLSGSRMLVVLNEKGDVIAFSGGTVQGTGAMSVQVANAVISSGAVIAGAKAIEHGLENGTLNVKGIPNSININTDNNVVIANKGR